MNKTNKRLHKQRQRERARGIERQRRIEADQCNGLMYAAEAAWQERDFEGALRTLNRVLQMRPRHAEALERYAEACFILNRSEEGLERYEQLRQSPVWIPVIYSAAEAAY